MAHSLMPPLPLAVNQTGARLCCYQRRSLVYGLIGAGIVFSSSSYSESAGASKRQPPPSPKEKMDPNVSGVQAKVLASKKRKEAMKEEVARLRERGTPAS